MIKRSRLRVEKFLKSLVRVLKNLLFLIKGVRIKEKENKGEVI
jgi:hypothetical protein